MTYLRSFMLLVLALLVISVVTKAGEGVQLRYSPVKNNVYSYVFSSSLKQTMGDIDMSTSMESEQTLDFRAVAVEKTSCTFNIRNSDFKVSVAGLSMAGVPDTTMIVPATSVTESLELASNGTIISRRMQQSPDKQVHSPQTAMLGQLNKQSFQHLLIPLPAKKIAQGETWKQERRDTSETGMITMMIFQFSYLGMKDTLGKKCAVISCKSTMMAIEGSIAQMGVNMTIEGEGTARGTLFIESSSGMAVTGRVAVQADIRMAITGQENMIIPVDMETITTFSRK